MFTIDKIKADQVAARKARETIKATLLTTLIGEAEMVGKNAGRSVTEDEVQAILKKFVKNLKEVIQLTSPETSAHFAAQGEKAVLEAYMPKQLSEGELAKVIADLIAVAPVGAKMGDIMSKLKESHGGLYDGKTASQLIKAALA